MWLRRCGAWCASSVHHEARAACVDNEGGMVRSDVLSATTQEVALSISGNLSYADRLERLAYNALPAALWPDLKANVRA
jgi:hypothetical protein